MHFTSCSLSHTPSFSLPSTQTHLSCTLSALNCLPWASTSGRTFTSSRSSTTRVRASSVGLWPNRLCSAWPAVPASVPIAVATDWRVSEGRLWWAKKRESHTTVSARWYSRTKVGLLSSLRSPEERNTLENVPDWSVLIAMTDHLGWWYW